MTDFGRRTALHAADHEDGGSDEIDVAALSGELTDDQPAKAHALGGAKHTAATLAELNAKISDATLDDSGGSRTPSAHKTSHGSGGTDEIDVTGLVGATARALLGDATASRVIRLTRLIIGDGTNNNTIKCTLTNRWNGDDIAETDNIPKDGSSGHYSLVAVGHTITIAAAGLTGNALAAFSLLAINKTTTDLTIQGWASTNNIKITFYDTAAGAPQDITSIIDAGDIEIELLYLTDA